MPAVARVVENTVMGDGTIKSVVRISALHEVAAKKRAKNRALLHNGYDKALSKPSKGVVEVEVKEMELVKERYMTKIYRVVVELSNVGRYLE